MARLTRTQKYAALREELANSSEQTTVNNDLNKFQNKLASIQNASEKEKIDDKEDYNIKIEPLPTFKEVKDEIKEEKKIENDFFADFDLDSINKEIDKIVKENVEILDSKQEQAEFDLGLDKEISNPERKEEPEIDNKAIDKALSELEDVAKEVKEEKPVVIPERIEEPYNYIEENYADIAKQLEAEVVTLNGKVEPVKEEPVLIKPVVIPERKEEPYNYIEQNYKDIANLLEKELVELNGKVEPIKEEEPLVSSTSDQVMTDIEIDVPKLDELDVNEEVELPQIEEENKPVVAEETLDEPLVNVSDKDISSLLDSTLAEVADYNNQAGRMNVDQISNDLIEEVRHNNYTDDKEDEDFSNTVTLEIDKVLSEINLEPIAPVNVDKVLDKTVEIDPIDIKRNEAAEKLADTLAHPVLAKTLESAPVEIKSLDETFTKDMPTSTLSFKKDAVVEDEEEDDDYYYDDDKPNKIMNIVIIILSVVFLVIVGIIIYFLLLAKGIL